MDGSSLHPKPSALTPVVSHAHWLSRLKVRTARPRDTSDGFNEPYYESWGVDEVDVVGQGQDVRKEVVEMPHTDPVQGSHDGATHQ